MLGRAFEATQHLAAAYVPDAQMAGLAAVLGLDLIRRPRHEIVLARRNLDEFDVVVDKPLCPAELHTTCERAKQPIVSDLPMTI